MADDYYDTRRRSSYFPAVALNRGYSLEPRFTGILQPSPRGTYYNPSRYAGEGFNRSQLNRIQGNLATQYTKDLEFNRLANPYYQPTMDTGYSSTAPFGSGRASPATVQNYALQYGTPTGNGLSTFQTPSGGSITYRPSGRKLTGGLSGGGATPGSSPYIQQGQGGVAAPYSSPNVFQRFGSNLGQIASNAASFFFPGANPAIVQRATNPSLGQTFNDANNFVSSGGPWPRRYLDY